jgi:hypothetical protein
LASKRKEGPKAQKGRISLPVLNDAPSGLPYFSAKWAPEILASELPTETLATCSDCAMRPPEGEEFTPEGPYFGTTRCCTHVPTTANFLVGALFLDPDPALEDGRTRAAARIAKRAGLSPLGLVPTGLEAMTLKNVWGAFGKHRAVICPNFREADGACTVWRYRSAVCMTWFCKHVRGAKGHAVWRAAEHFIRAMERAVALHCVLTVDLGDEAFAAIMSARLPDRELSVFDLDGGRDEASAERLWGRWAGRERQFFEACAEVAFGLDAEAVMRIGGAELAVAARAVKGALERLEDTGIPKHLMVRGFEIVSIGPEVTRLKTYSPYDPLEVPNELVPLLSMFDGRSTRAVIEAVHEEHGVLLDDELLQQLVDFELLTPVT